MGGSQAGLGPWGLCGTGRLCLGQQDAGLCSSSQPHPAPQVPRPQLPDRAPWVRRGVDLEHLGPVELGRSPVLGTSHTVPLLLSPDPTNPRAYGDLEKGS